MIPKAALPATLTQLNLEISTLTFNDLCTAIEGSLKPIMAS